MNIPANVIECWFVSEEEYVQALNDNKPFSEFYRAADYFLRLKKMDAFTMEGYIGRYDKQEDFHNQILSNYTFFEAYNQRKKIYITFDRATLYQVTEIYPSKPLIFTVKQISNYGQSSHMINQEAIYQLMYKEQWPEIIQILHRNKTDIANEPTLQHAAKTFETVFLQKVNSFAVNDTEINHVLELLYTLHFGKFYQLNADNLKKLTIELAKRTPLKEAYNYAKAYPEDETSLQIIKKYLVEKGTTLSDTKPMTITYNWIEIYNRLFEMINNQGDTATYFSGPRFIDAVKEVLPYSPDYSQYILLRNQEGKSTSRKIFYYDILMGVDEQVRVQIIEKIIGVVRPFLPEKAKAIEMLMGKKVIDHKVILSTEAETETAQNPVVFISYSWDDELHKEWVLKLANKLTGDGIKVLLDRFSLKPGKSLPHFVEQSIAKANRVVIVFTPNYKLKADKRSGGVGYEYSIMNADLYQNQTTNEKIIPVLRTGDMLESIPAFMQQFIHLDLRNDDNFDNSYSDLIREIYNEPAIKQPEIGTKPMFN